jgi:hypothetical protein
MVIPSRLLEALRWENDFWTQAAHKTERKDSMLLYIGIVIGIREWGVCHS